MGKKQPSSKSHQPQPKPKVRPKAKAASPAAAKTVRKPTRQAASKPAAKSVSKPAAKSAKKPVKKTAAKPVKKTAPKGGKAQPVRKHPVEKKSPMPTSSAKAAKSGKSAETKPVPAEKAPRLSPDALRKQLVAQAKARAKPQRAVAFTLDDVRGELAKARPSRKDSAKGDATTKVATAPGKRIVNEIKPTHRHFGAASLADILGYNPVKEDMPENEEATIDKKYLRYYRLLAQLRDHVKSGLALHADETLKRSSRDDAGDLSGYGQHMADAGTDAFDRDFALSLVSSEQEALFEIEEAIKRIKKGTYGVCELTGKPIHKDRLVAVPFARYSVESQAEVEKTRRRSSQRGGLFGDVAGEEGAKIADDDGE